MRATVIPAQVTTVEDRVAGNISLSQLALLALPIFGGSLLYAILPPSLDFAWYKIIALAGLVAISFTLAIRIKGKILLFWLVILMRYHLRPKLYLFSKNSSCYRTDYPVVKPTKATPEVVPSPEKTVHVYDTKLDLDLVSSIAQLEFNGMKKGKFYVRIRS